MKILCNVIVSFTVLVFVGLVCEAAVAEPIRMGFEYANGARTDKRETQFTNFAASGLNTFLINSRLISPAITTMQYNSQTGEVTIVNWLQTANLNEMPLQCPNDFIDFANDANAHGLNVMFTHCLWWGDWDVLNILPSYSKTYVNGPTRYETPGENDVPSPLDSGFWLGIQLCAAKFYANLSLQCPNIKGFMMDFETYSYGSHQAYLPRKNSSFDNQTWAAVTAEMVNRGILGSVPSVSISQRYSWLESNGVLQSYFDVQGDLVYTQIALPFRQAIDAINPNFMLGFYPYWPNEYLHGWVRGLATANAPVIIMSEEEYSAFNAPQSLSRADKLDNLQINYRYLPGFMIHAKTLTPNDLQLNIKRSEYFIGDGYWVYDTTTMWSAPWDLNGTAAQFWAAITNGNNPSISLPTGERYLSMNRAPTSPSVLVTANRFFDGTKNALPIQVTYSPQNPNLKFHEDAQKTKLFDGGEVEEYWTAAWNPVLGQNITTVVDLSRTIALSKIYLRGGHYLQQYSTTGGTLTISTSTDGQAYTQLYQVYISAGLKLKNPFVFENLTITGRYIKIEFLPDAFATSYPAFPLSELAVWQHAVSCGDWGYSTGDLNTDCHVNFSDLAIFALDWLKCSDPTDSNCESAL